MEQNVVPTAGTPQETTKGEASVRLLPYPEDPMRWGRTLRELCDYRIAMLIPHSTQESRAEGATDWETA
jgi:hypothetical protein